MYNIVVWQEGKYFVGKVLQNSVSSFWCTREEALNNTKEALELYNEWNNTWDDVEISSPELYNLELSHA